MSPENKKKYLAIVEKELAAKQESLESIEHGRNTAESAMTSHHDHLRSDLATDASIVMGLVDSLNKFRAMLENSEPLTAIEIGAIFKASLVEEGEVLEAIFSPVKIVVKGLTTLTPESPLGQKLKGLQVGDAFFYGPDKDHQMLGLVDYVE